MIATIQKLVRSADAAVARAYLAMRREQNALMPFLFHSLFRNQREMDLNVVEPLERTTVTQFRQFVEYYLEHGYRFVSPAELLEGLKPDGKYALITFDDGYYNNTLARAVLEEFKVPALFFISTNHVRQNKCFWWDVYYRERLAQGASRRQIYRETVGLKGMRTEEIEAMLVARFGAGALTPRGDVDRPFTPAELRDFAACPYVHLGNHTANHAILTNYTPEEVREQVAGAQAPAQPQHGGVEPARHLQRAERVVAPAVGRGGQAALQRDAVHGGLGAEPQERVAQAFADSCHDVHGTPGLTTTPGGGPRSAGRSTSRPCRRAAPSPSPSASPR